MIGPDPRKSGHLHVKCVGRFHQHPASPGRKNHTHEAPHEALAPQAGGCPAVTCRRGVGRWEEWDAGDLFVGNWENWGRPTKRKQAEKTVDKLQPFFLQGN